MLHLYSAFLGTQSALHSKGESPRPPPMCSIHLNDDATAAIVRQNTPPTPATGGEETEMKTISVWGWWGGHDGQRPVGEFGQDTGVTPLLFLEGFLMTTERWKYNTFNYDRVCSLIHYNLDSLTQAWLQNQIPEGAS